jgi:AcrR family transcriptional regulator
VPQGPQDDARRPPGRPPVALDRIVATALQIVDEDGADALSMRTLAQRLDSGTATLYRHFTGRADLMAHVVDRVFGAVELDRSNLAALGWQSACKAAAHNIFDALRAHRNVAPLLAERVPAGPNAMAARELFLALLQQNGFPPPLAARAYATIARYVLGFAIQDREGEDASQAFHDLDPNLFPATVAAAQCLPVPLDVEFAFGLDLIVDGLARRLRDER